MKQEEIMQRFFEIASNAIINEDYLLQRHCENEKCGCHHGISWLTESTIMYLICRSLIKNRFRYQVRAEQPYPDYNNKYADLTILNNGEWIACIEAKWIQDQKTVEGAKKDIERMKKYLEHHHDIGKFFLAFWCMDPRLSAYIPQWIDELKKYDIDNLRKEITFKTSFWDEYKNKYIEVDAGMTLFTIK